MTQSVKELRGDEIVARDGRLGAVDDVYFDDEAWTVRYLVVDTGKWIPGRKVLISPASIEGPSRAAEEGIAVDLTREQVKNAPGIETDKPVSRRLEEAHAQYYGYPFYWAGPYLWGPQAYPMPPAGRMTGRPATDPVRTELETARGAEREQAAASSLRSGAEVIGYHIEARDGALGHVEDFVLDDRSWAITGLVVDTRNWLPGKHVMVPPEAIESIGWEERTVRVGLTRDEIRSRPEAL